MAKYRFFVGRTGAPAVECTADVPDQNKLLAFTGGTVLVTTPNGTFEVDVPSATELVEKQMRILLQHGVRDHIFPNEKAQRVSKKRTGYTE